MPGTPLRTSLACFLTNPPARARRASRSIPHRQGRPDHDERCDRDHHLQPWADGHRCCHQLRRDDAGRGGSIPAPRHERPWGPTDGPEPPGPSWAQRDQRRSDDAGRLWEPESLHCGAHSRERRWPVAPWAVACWARMLSLRGGPGARMAQGASREGASLASALRSASGDCAGPIAAAALKKSMTPRCAGPQALQEPRVPKEQSLVRMLQTWARGLVARRPVLRQEPRQQRERLASLVQVPRSRCLPREEPRYRRLPSSSWQRASWS
jgi:hypothetical protein